MYLFITIWFFNGLLMALFTVSWVILQWPLTNTHGRSTFGKSLSIGFMAGWATTILLFLGMHCVYLLRNPNTPIGSGQDARHHWMKVRLGGAFILNVIFSAIVMSLAVALYHGENMDQDLAVKVAPPIVSAAVWLNTLIGENGQPFNTQVSIGGTN